MKTAFLVNKIDDLNHQAFNYKKWKKQQMKMTIYKIKATKAASDFL